MAMSERWLRWYDGSVRDGKFRIVADECGETVATVIGVWASILEDASMSNPRGNISHDIDWHAMYLDIAPELVANIWDAMVKTEILERFGTEKNASEQFGTAGTDETRLGTKIVLRVKNWDRRQYETDAKDPTAKERKKRWKQPHSETPFQPVPDRSAERSGTPESKTESESESESKRQSPPPEAGAPPLQPTGNRQRGGAAAAPGFAEFWLAYPKKVCKPAAERAFKQAIKRASLEVMLAALNVQKKTWHDPQYIKYPAKWLNNDCWNDEVMKTPEWSNIL
jgi:hypothetical protein